MWRFLQSILEIILPQKERVVRSEKYSIADLSIEPREHESCGVRITTLMEYRTRAVADLIQALKYDRAEHAAKLLAEALAEYFREEIASLKAFSAKQIVLVPVPLHSSRIRERGFNQVEVILASLPEEFKDGTLSRIETHALLRTRATKQQTRLSRKERLHNVRDAFELSAPEKIKNAHVILIDDVTTTGATLAHASRPFEQKHIRISLVALAHA
jgi:ComF family protein